MGALMPDPLVIAIDGTFASGKGTLAKRLAAHYGLKHLDTGKLYRATARDVLASGGSLDDAAFAASVAAKIDPDSLDDPFLKSGGMGAGASKVSVHPAVRQALFDFQRSFATQGAVLDGRDIGTVICPDAQVKLFVDAEPEVRAERRFQELRSYGEEVTFEKVLTALNERDYCYINGAVAPLRPDADAHLMDRTQLYIVVAVRTAVTLIDAVLNAKAS